MSETTCKIRGIDPLLFRDGRPFTTDAGGRADTLPLPFPSTIAGFLRTKYGRARLGNDCDWPAVSAAIRLRGPLLARGEGVLFPAPADALVHRPDRDSKAIAVTRLLPRAPDPDVGTDICGAMRPMDVTVEAKPARGYETWPAAAMMAWLDGNPVDGCDLEADIGLPRQHRVHIEMRGDTGTTEEGRLFSTSMVGFEHHAWPDDGPADSAEFVLLCRVAGAEDAAALRGPGTLGGENRCAVVEPEPDSLWPDCPSPLAEALRGAKRVRMILATPAIFERGWIPKWLDNTTKTGPPPGLEGRLALKLVAAAVPRRVAVSGWDYTTNRPKPVRWCAPAGSTYFFEVESGDPGLLGGEAWLAPVSDDECEKTPGRTLDKNRSDGFGLALWGIWAEQDDRKKGLHAQ
ncbi:MAG TPA: type III-B CRISPR module-associated protein Cmr3 [Chthonomonadaceae bacterium]|nr:type III-B CRISPR module-associated protein Cmr3 [Chthonomonadaceae bacterium]